VLRTSDLEYDLPPGRIATHPAEPRDAARLMVVDRIRGTVEHGIVRDLPAVLRAGDLLVTNESRVLPARFLGVREDTGGGVEGLYLREAGGAPRPRWIAMIRARRFRPGATVRLFDRAGAPSAVAIRLVERVDGPEWLVEPSRDDGREAATPAILDLVGLPPIPPYILGARKLEGSAAGGNPAAPSGAGATRSTASSSTSADSASYQTVFAGALTPSADCTELGSVAAPTAGLHFTPELLSRLERHGVRRAGVVLHVGPGTFKPVEAEFVERHPMHAEWCSMPTPTRDAIERTRSAGGRVVCVGTTSARTLEAFAAESEQRASEHGGAPPSWLHTRLLITPGYRFRLTDALLTNFHLPRSTLMALVAAMLPGGVDQLKSLYAEAMARNYRFYSYGDAMLIL
jgi:S-adenosylmethionine:tRNA ribosyltransferase-isomerase